MLLTQEQVNEVLLHFDSKYHNLLKTQIMIISQTIEENNMRYKYSEDFKKALNLILTDVINGRYLGVDLE